MKIVALCFKALRASAVAPALWVLVLFSSPVWPASVAQQYQQLGTGTNSLVVAAVLHFVTDPRRGTARDELALQALIDAEQQVRQQAARLGLKEPTLESMLASLEGLRGLSSLDTDYPPLLMGVLDQHARLGKLIDEAYRQHSVMPHAELMNRQSRRIAQLRLHAVARNARMLGAHSLLDEAVFIQLDREIEEGFMRLEGILPEAELQHLQQQHKAYRFVRMGLLQADSLRSSSALELYITRMLAWLDSRAVEVDETSEALLEQRSAGSALSYL